MVMWFVSLVRPLIPAIDTWAMDDVAWMFTGEASVDNDMHRMLDWRKENHIIVEFFHIMQSVQKCDGWKANPLRGKIMDLKKGVEDRLFERAGWVCPKQELFHSSFLPLHPPAWHRDIIHYHTSYRVIHIHAASTHTEGIHTQTLQIQYSV